MSQTLTAGDRMARHNALVLSCATALAGANASVVIATGGLVGQMLSGEAGMATVPILTFVVGTALATFPAALSMRRFGRRAGFIAGCLIGVLGGLLGALAILRGSFGLFCAATAGCGMYQAFVMQYRFAAADTATPSYRPKAISWVLAGGVAAAFVGPQTIIATKDAWAPHVFAVTFVAQAAFALAAALVLLALRAPPPADEPRGVSRSLTQIFANRYLVCAVLLAMLAQAVMNLVMTATPLAMVGCGLPVSSAALAIQWHILGMFGPSFVTGRLITRYGRIPIAVAGFALMALCGAVALAGLDVLHFYAALILLGVGWNFAFVSATTMVTDCYRPQERAKVQAANDFIVFAGTALASFGSGVLLARFGWTGVVVTLFPVAVVGILLLARQRVRVQQAI